MQWWNIWCALAILCTLPTACTRGTTLMGKRESHIIRKTAQLTPQNILYVHNSRGSVYAQSGNVKQPKLEAHVFGPEGATHQVVISQKQDDKKQTVHAYVQEQQQDDSKKKKQPTLSDFSIDYYITVPQQAGIVITSDNTLYASVEGLKGHVGIEGESITSYIQNAGKSVSIDVSKGDVTVTNARGYTDIHTRSGTVSLFNIFADVNASAHGVITIKNVQGNAFLHNQRGHMYITDVAAVLNAQSRDGITVTQHTFSENTNIFLDARGSVNIYLPENAHAYILASTIKGIVTSDLAITLDPITTHLSKDVWKHMQKHVKGTLGSGGAYMKIDAGNYIHIHEISE